MTVVKDGQVELALLRQLQLLRLIRLQGRHLVLVQQLLQEHLLLRAEAMVTHLLRGKRLVADLAEDLSLILPEGRQLLEQALADLSGILPLQVRHLLLLGLLLRRRLSLLLFLL